MPFIADPIPLSEQQRADLNEIAQSRPLPAGFVFRAKLILMLAEGAPFAAIKEWLQTTAPTISRCKQRFWRTAWKGWTPIRKAAALTDPAKLTASGNTATRQ